MADINLDQLTGLASQQRSDLTSRLAGQQTQESDYLKKYTDFINSQEGSQAMATRLGSELGIPTLQANATMLRNTLTNLPSTYSASSRGYDINQNQLSRIIGQKSSELSPMVTTAENSLQAAQGNLATQMGYQTADQARLEKPYALEQSTMETRIARETSGYSEADTNELNALIAKINSQVLLNNAEQARVQELAMKEKDFENAKATAASAGPNTQIVTVNGVQKLINSQTGQVIQILGSSAAPAIKSTTGNYFNASSGGQPVSLQSKAGF